MSIFTNWPRLHRLMLGETSYRCLESVKCKSMQNLIKNIPWRSRVVSIFTKIPRPAEIILGEPHHRFGYQKLDNFKIYKYVKYHQLYHVVQEVWSF